MQVQAEVDAGGDAGARADPALVDVERVGVDVDRRESGGQLRRLMPVGRGGRVRRAVPRPPARTRRCRPRPRVRHARARPSARRARPARGSTEQVVAGHDHGVRRRQRAEAVVDLEREPRHHRQRARPLRADDERIARLPPRGGRRSAPESRGRTRDVGRASATSGAAWQHLRISAFLPLVGVGATPGLKPSTTTPQHDGTSASSSSRASRSSTPSGPGRSSPIGPSANPTTAGRHPASPVMARPSAPRTALRIGAHHAFDTAPELGVLLLPGGHGEGSCSPIRASSSGCERSGRSCR